MKYSVLTFILFGFILVCCAPVTPSPTAIPTNSPAVTETSIPTEETAQITETLIQTDIPSAGDLALAHMDSISNGIGSRPAGSEQEAQTVQYIVKVFEKLRYPSQVQPFTVIVNGNTIQSANVIAVKQGISSQEIIVGAHY